jgi:polyribonucleotide nucleotidyltransferase
MESNGSTSMASTCASCMSLMAAGVPIRKPVAGISCGLVTGDSDDEYLVLTDIQGLEDFFGDMDFKVTGTRDGITAIQMDIKIHGLTRPIVEEAIKRAREARLFIMDGVMKDAIAEPRKELSPYAPKIITLQIETDKIGDVIGKQGKTITAIIDETGAKIDIDDSGMVSISGIDLAALERAKEIILSIVNDIEPGQILEGTVVRMMNFGAFVQLSPTKDGMVHISKLSDKRVNEVEDVVHIGDKVRVKVIEVDKMGRINLSMRPQDLAE